MFTLCEELVGHVTYCPCMHADKLVNDNKSYRYGDKQFGQWLWLSWQSGCFKHQRSAVRIQSLAKFYMEHLFTVNCIEKTNINKKMPGMVHF